MAGFVLNRIGRVRSDWLYFFHKNARIRYRLAIIVRSRVVNPCGRTAVPVLSLSIFNLDDEFEPRSPPSGHNSDSPESRKKLDDA